MSFTTKELNEACKSLNTVLDKEERIKYIGTKSTEVAETFQKVVEKRSEEKKEIPDSVVDFYNTNFTEDDDTEEKKTAEKETPMKAEKKNKKEKKGKEEKPEKKDKKAKEEKPEKKEKKEKKAKDEKTVEKKSEKKEKKAKAEKPEKKEKPAKKEKKEKKEGTPRDFSGSNKAKIYLAWKDGENDVKKLLKIAKGGVSEKTLKRWMSSWKNGKALPAIARH